MAGPPPSFTVCMPLGSLSVTADPKMVGGHEKPVAVSVPVMYW
tara:strand:+ start:26051 stop:26179 length:129 start_codon:yes stop_codon:yes gene_type:complete